LRRVLKSGFLYQLCSKAYLEVLENYNQVSDAHTASPRMFAYQKTRKHPSKSDSRNSILLSKVAASLVGLRGIEKGASKTPNQWYFATAPRFIIIFSCFHAASFQIQLQQKAFCIFPEYEHGNSSSLLAYLMVHEDLLHQ